MEPLEQNFPVVLFIMLYKAVITFESVDEILKFDHWAGLSCGAVCSVLYKAVIAFGYVDEILKCDHSNESYRVALSCGAIY